METMRYFPKEDIWYLGGLSPKALIHDHGVLLSKNGEPVELLEKPIKPKKRKNVTKEEHERVLKQYLEELKAWNEEIRGSYTLIDLSNIILVFLEAPEYETYHMLLPILSHDVRRIEYKFTDKTTKGRLRTSKVIIQGWPATIFLSTDKKYIKELVTRSFTTTPESSKEKVSQAKQLRTLKVAYPWKYEKETEEMEVARNLILNIRKEFLKNNLSVSTPFSNLEALFPEETVRIMREYEHFTQLIWAFTALHLFQRPILKRNGKLYLLSNRGDVQMSLIIYQMIFETTRTGTEESLLSFYYEIVATERGWFLKDITEVYNEKHPNDKRSSNTIGKWMKRLSEIGYVDIHKSDFDSRINKYVPIMKKSEKVGFTENQANLKPKLKIGFENWLENVGEDNQFFIYDLFNGTIELKEITLEQVRNIIL